MNNFTPRWGGQSSQIIVEFDSRNFLEIFIEIQRILALIVNFTFLHALSNFFDERVRILGLFKPKS